MSSLEQLSVYTETDSEEDEHVESRLPLPDFVANLTYRDAKPEVNEEGKVRNFPHERGNWATYLFVPMDPCHFNEYLKLILNVFKPLGLKLCDEFHISLTRTVVLRHHWIQEFVANIKKNLANIKSFKIYLRGLKAYRNEEKTRSFLSVEVIEGEDKLQQVVSHLNKSFKDFNLDGYYENPSFHMSLLWCPGDKLCDISKAIDLAPSKIKNFSFSKEVSHCLCATGNKKFTFAFN